MTDNDINLIRQMMKAGRHKAVYDFMPEYNLAKSQAIIKEMGDKCVATHLMQSRD